MKVLVASGFQAGSQKANALNTIGMAEGFASAGAEVCLATRRGVIHSGSEFKRLYGDSADIGWSGVSGVVGHGVGFVAALMPILQRFRPDVVFARSFSVPAVTTRMRVPTVFETHAHVGTDHFWFRRAVKSTQSDACRALITINNVLADYYVQRGALREKVCILPTGVDCRRFARPKTLPSSPYPARSQNVTYAGHLYDYKGIPLILEAAAQLHSVNFHLVGGLEGDVARVGHDVAQRGLHNVFLHGHQNQAELGRFLWHADALLLPPTSKHASARWTSPVKLGEYLAAETPVIASDIPALRDLVSDDEVLFFTPDDTRSFVERVNEALAGGVQVARVVASGRKRAHSWSYQERARRILEYV